MASAINSRYGDRTETLHDPAKALSACGMTFASGAMNDQREAIRRQIDRHCTLPRQDTIVPGLSLFNCPASTEPKRSIYDPRLCLVFQGAKRVLLGDTAHEVSAGSALLATIDLPVTAYVTEATPERPHLALTVTLERARVAAVRSQMNAPRVAADTPVGLQVAAQEDDLLAPVLRLLDLLDRPADIAMLYPLIEWEIIYRLLNGGFGAVLSGFAAADVHLAQITRATQWIRNNFDQPLRIADLAAQIGMSATSFHRHFKAVTSMTPLQYRREIRLSEARRHLLAGTHRAAEAGAAVGYDSPAQFSREYRRSFGQPPVTSIKRFRNPGA
jgi:AraC-like DNA-binding protein